MSKSSNKEKILSIVTAGVCVALSFVLSEIKLFEMPMGGSVTPASALPLVVFAMAFGPFWAFLAAFAFSVIQFILGMEWFVSPFQMILDYVLGYTCMGFIGFAALKSDKRLAIKNPLKRFTNASIYKALIFTTIAYAARWFCSVLSGVIFYADYAPEGMNAWVYSMTYNGSFMVVDLIIVLVATVVIYGIFKGTSKKS